MIFVQRFKTQKIAILILAFETNSSSSKYDTFPPFFSHGFLIKSDTCLFFFRIKRHLPLEMFEWLSIYC